MLRRIVRWLTDDGGQDLAEYTLLIALIALVAAGVMIQLSGGVQGIWGTSNSTLATASTVAGGTGSGSSDSSAPPNGSGGSPTTGGGDHGHGDGDHHGDHDGR